MIAKLESLFEFIAGDLKHTPLELRIFNTISFLNGFLNLVGGLSVLYMENGFILFLLNGGTGLVYLLLWYLARVKKPGKMHYWPFAFLTLFFLGTNWITNAGSSGGAHYYMIAAAIFMVILSRKPATIIASFVLFVSVATLLFALEYTKPELITEHANRTEKYLDLLLNYTFVQVFSASLVLILARNLNQERKKSEKLLRNILPGSVADELIQKERVEPRQFENCTVIFTDFSGFTALSGTMTAEELVQELDETFQVFDRIMAEHGIEKIKTIGDSYMAVSGVPEPVEDHAIRAIGAALEIRDYVAERVEEAKRQNRKTWGVRIGIHSGPLVAGVIGNYKFAYDVWGDTVNTASRMESSGEVGRINISRKTFELIRGQFHCDYRGFHPVKGKGEVEMYFVDGPATENG